MNNETRLIAVALMVIWSTAGCKPDKQQSKPPEKSDGPEASVTTKTEPEMQYHIDSNDKTYRVSFTPEPSPIPTNEPFTLDVVVRRVADDTHGGKLELAVDAAMPEHQHGMNTQPRVTAQADGRFLVEGMLFHMPGHWELYFDITDAAVAERAQFDVNLE